jgi:hypothetical protein
VYSLGVGVEGHIGVSDEILENFVVAPDHSAGVHEVEVGDSVIDLQDVGFELSGGHYGDVLDLVYGATVSNDCQFFAWLHNQRI